MKLCVLEVSGAVSGVLISGPSPGGSLGNEIFSLLMIPFEWAALNKLRASQMLFV